MTSLTSPSVQGSAGEVSASSNESSSFSKQQDPQQQQQQQQQPPLLCLPQIRHCGPAWIRGKIRRVWRPRYLELLDSGCVRYYELPDTHHHDAAVAVGDDEALNDDDDDDDDLLCTAAVFKIHKYTLNIFHSVRILDGTTLRDMHVGLPRGTFGFLFRGQRLPSSTSTSQQQGRSGGSYENPFLASCAGGSGTAVAGAASSMTGSSNNASITTGSTVRAGSATTTTTTPLAKSTPLIGGVEQQRDFFCAVRTLEEAQMWVVALTWAADRTLERQQAAAAAYVDQPLNWKDDDDVDGNLVDDPQFVLEEEKDGMVSVDIKSSSTKQPGDDDISPKSNNNNASDPSQKNQSLLTTTTTHVSKSPPPAPSNNISAFATKVTQYRVVRLRHSWQLEIAYEIHVLLLETTQRQITPSASDILNTHSTTITTASSSNNNNNNKLTQLHRQADSWIILRSATDFETLVKQLCKETSSATTTTTATQQENVLLRTILRLGRLTQSSSSSDSGSTSSSTTTKLPNHAHLQSSLSIVDSLLRSFVMDASLVNTRALKEFLGLTQQQQPQSNDKVRTTIPSLTSPTSSWLTYFSAMDVLPLPLRCFLQPHPISLQAPSSNSSAFATASSRTSETIPVSISTDQHVRGWIQQKRHVKTSALDVYMVSAMGRFGSSRLLLGSGTDTTGRMSGAIWTPEDATGLSITTFSITAAAAALSVPFVSSLWRQCMPRITLRLDYLLVSYVGAAYLGSCVFQPHPTSSRPTSPSTATAASASANKTTKLSGTANEGSPRNAKGQSAVLVSAEKRRTKKKTTNVGAEASPADYSDDTDSDFVSTGSFEYEDDDDDDEEVEQDQTGFGTDAEVKQLKDDDGRLSSPLPKYPENDGFSCWSEPPSNIFHVRGSNYLKDRIKVQSDGAPMTCRGVDIWMTDNPERHIARHPSVLGGKLGEEDTFLVNFLLPFGNFVAYFAIPPLNKFPRKLKNVWTKFLKGDQEYRDARLKLLPVVVEGPWIVKTAVGSGKSPALLGKVIPLQYYFRDGDRHNKAVYEVDVIITASTIAKGILSVVKGHTKSVAIAFSFIIEAALEEELPETVLCNFQIHSMDLQECPLLPPLPDDSNNSSNNALES